jgi:carbon starvation protein CstA
MKREYDFSKGIRGKFYRPDVQLQLPVYLDEDVADFVPYSDGTGYGLALGTTAGAGLVAGVESRAVTGMNG